MEEYVVGSIANLISGKKIPKVKRRKEEVKAQETVEEGKKVKKNYRFHTETLMSENEKESSSKPSFSKQNNNESQVKKKKSTLSKHKTDVKVPKKRKAVEANTDAVETEEETKSKKRKEDLSELNQEPDSVVKGKRKKRGKSAAETDKLDRPQGDAEDFNKNTVFVGNIPLTYDQKKVCKVFSKFGKILSARIRCVPVAEINMKKKVAAIKKKYHPKRNSLVAYVKYSSEDAAKAALEANGMVVDGHHLRVDAAEENKKRDNSKAVFVGGLPFDIEDDELWEFFKNCGNIENVRIIRDSQSSMGKGFGYVNFDSAASVELALQLDGQELKKRTINVKRCVRIKSKNKLNTFDKRKSKERVHKMPSKKGRKYKEENKKLKLENKFSNEFQGRTANMKHKNKKKLSQTALRRRKLVKILEKS